MKLGAQRSDFQDVVELNEAAKQLIARSFKVNLLALDALVQSKQTGCTLPGFDEVSSQMRMWSRDLHSQLETLAELSREVVSKTSSFSKEARHLQLLQLAATYSNDSHVRQTAADMAQRQSGREYALKQHWRRLRAALADLDQLGMMAIVLSRSAMIEAASAAGEQRAHLTNVSREFYKNSEATVEVLRALLKALETK